MTVERSLARRVARELQLERSSDERRVYFHGETMKPFLREGDRLATVLPIPGSLRIGDLVIYRDGEEFPVRRVVEWLPRRAAVRVRGDNCAVETGRIVEVSKLLAQVVERRRDGESRFPEDLSWRVATARALARIWLFELAGSAQHRRRLVRRAVRRARRFARLGP